jgi:hypothetical protein
MSFVSRLEIKLALSGLYHLSSRCSCKYSSRVGVLMTSILKTAYAFAENHTNSHVYAVDSK